MRPKGAVGVILVNVSVVAVKVDMHSRGHSSWYSQPDDLEIDL